MPVPANHLVVSSQGDILGAMGKKVLEVDCSMQFLASSSDSLQCLQNLADVQQWIYEQISLCNPISNINFEQAFKRILVLDKIFTSSTSTTRREIRLGHTDRAGDRQPNPLIDSLFRAIERFAERFVPHEATLKEMRIIIGSIGMHLLGSRFTVGPAGHYVCYAKGPKMVIISSYLQAALCPWCFVS